MRTPRDKEAQKAIPLNERLLFRLKDLAPEKFSPGWIKTHANTVWRDAARRPSLNKLGEKEIDWSFISDLPLEWANRFKFVPQNERAQKGAAKRTKYLDIKDVVDAVEEKAGQSDELISPSWIKKNLPTAFDRIREEKSLRHKKGSINWPAFKKHLSAKSRKRWHEGITEESKKARYDKKRTYTAEKVGKLITELVTEHKPSEIGLRWIGEHNRALGSALSRSFTLRQSGLTSVDWPEALFAGAPGNYLLQTEKNQRKLIAVYSELFLGKHPELPFSPLSIKQNYPQFSRWIQLTLGNDWYQFESLIPEHRRSLWQRPSLNKEDASLWLPEFWFTDEAVVGMILSKNGFSSGAELARSKNVETVDRAAQALCKEAWRGNSAVSSPLLGLLARVKNEAEDEVRLKILANEEGVITDFFSGVVAGDDRTERKIVTSNIYLHARQEPLRQAAAKVFQAYFISRTPPQL